MKKSNPFNAKNLSIFCSQMAMYTKAGIYYETGMENLIKNGNDAQINSILQNVIENLKNDDKLTTALEKTGRFPIYMINILKVANDTGSLEESFNSLSKYYERESEIIDTVKAAIIYPALLILMLLSVFLFLAIKVLPIFESALKNLGSEFTGLSKHILNFGYFISNNYIIFIIFVIVVFSIILYFTKTEKGKKIFVYKLWQSKLFEELSKSTIASSLATCIKSGLSIEYSLKLSTDAIFNKKIKGKAEECLEYLNNDQDFSEAISSSSLFTGLSNDIILTGIKTGSPDEALDFASSIFNDNFENKLQRKISLIEPISITILSILIGSVLISVMFPLINIISTIGA